VDVTLSNYFTNQNIVPSYYGVEVQFHAFFTTAIGGVLPILELPTATYLQTEPPGCTEFETGREEQKGRTGQENVSIPNYRKRSVLVPYRRLVTIYTELRRLQTKFPYIFSLHSNIQTEKKEKNFILKLIAYKFYDEIKPTKYKFKVNHIYRISLLFLNVSNLCERHLR
jgi:hypothetical protein